jgi:hypothetical protein
MNLKVLVFLGRQRSAGQFKDSEHMRIFWSFVVSGFYNIFFYLVVARTGNVSSHSHDISAEDIVYIRMTGLIQIAIIIALQVTYLSFVPVPFNDISSVFC